MSLPVLIFLILGLLSIQFLWIATYSYTAKEYFTDTFKKRIPATFLLVFFVLVCEFITGFLIPFPSGNYSLLLTIIGLSMYELGIALSVWAKLTMKENWGNPAEHNIERQKKLVTSGPFAFSRNPIYAGLLLIVLGFGIALKSYLIVLVIPLYYYFSNVIEVEENLLRTHFSKLYLDYCKTVRRFF